MKVLLQDGQYEGILIIAQSLSNELKSISSIRYLLKYAERAREFSNPLNETSLQFFLSDLTIACFPLLSNCYRILFEKDRLTNHEEAMSAILKACEYDRNNPLNYQLLGEYSSQLGDSERAVEAFTKSLKLKEDVSIRTLLEKEQTRL